MELAVNLEKQISESQRPDSIFIRRPTAASAPKQQAPTFSVNRPLVGLKVGLRTDHAWRSWQLIADIWAGYLERDEAWTLLAEVGSQTGSSGAGERKIVEDMATAVDCAIVGLGTCGSCTTYTIRDAVIVEDASKPVVAMVCEEFIVHARHVAKNVGHGNLKICVLPYPLEARPEAELRAIADQFYPEVLEMLGVER
jgi:hypothetical protein